MSKYVVIRTGGKQYKVSEGDKIKVEKLPNEVGKAFEFDEVLLSVDGDKVAIGKPTLSTKVKATLVEQIKDKKISVFKYKAKTGYHKKTGHRQSLSVVQINSIV
ncbi:MAG TPA: 50S ribosomal protein L21 [Candidatus Saccharimonadales bacterium]|nr:50S ribosomal protein L21 [Candidatus Saccharimonadales bacterium]